MYEINFNILHYNIKIINKTVDAKVYKHETFGGRGILL